MPLRILHALQGADPDAGRSIRAVCGFHALHRRFGHVIEIAAIGGTGGVNLEGVDMPVHRLRPGRGTGGKDPGFPRWMKEHAGDYDCVIAHGVGNFAGLTAWQVLRRTNVPYFIFNHGMLEPGSRPLGDLVKACYWPWLGYPLLRDACAVFFFSDDERDRARDASWLYDCRECVVRYGTRGMPAALAEGAAGSFIDAHPGLRGKRLFTFFADHDPMEGVHALAGAIAALARQGVWNGQSSRLVIAGGGDAAERDAVHRLAARYIPGDGVYSTGPLTETEAWGALRASEVFLRPSAHEICGERVANALSAGTPVLVSTGVAIWKDIAEVRAGLADEGTSRGCARLLRGWIGLSPENRAAIRKRARQCFETHFTLEGAANALTSAIYLRLALQGSERRRAPAA